MKKKVKFESKMTIQGSNSPNIFVTVPRIKDFAKQKIPIVSNCTLKIQIKNKCDAKDLLTDLKVALKIWIFSTTS